MQGENQMIERFDYGMFKTREKAELALEDYFANGEVSNADQPRIEPRKTSRGIWYAVALNGIDIPNLKF
jgi:hypothetical protein